LVYCLFPTARLR